MSRILIPCAVEVREPCMYNIIFPYFFSKPVSFCWYVTESNCILPKDAMCSPTLMNDACHMTFNHTFGTSGQYCVNVSAINSVGFANVLHYVDVEGMNFVLFLWFSLPIINSLASSTSTPQKYQVAIWSNFDKLIVKWSIPNGHRVGQCIWAAQNPATLTRGQRTS